MSTPRSVAFQTLGCKLNYAETSALGRQFEAAGYRAVSVRETADIYVINTCSVTDAADRKCRHAVRQVLRQNAQALVVVVGCYAQLKPEEVAGIPGVDLVLGAAEKFRMLPFIEGLAKSPGKGMVQAGEVSAALDFENAFSVGDRTRSFLKVQDGCDYRCTFCTIPQARGRSRSDSVAHVLSNVREIASRGVREIVLTGVNIGDFGNGTAVIEGEKPRKEALFADLIEALDDVPDIARFRISSIEPNLCTPEIIQTVAGSRRFAPHFHMPLQSGNDKQLRDMKRRYRRDLFRERVEEIRQWMPHACIGVDVIVGFPGETESDFEESYAFISSLEVSYLHVFTYSERENTPAAQMPGSVAIADRRRRNALLTSLSEQKRMAFYRSHLGQSRPILFERSRTAGRMSGFTDNYIRIETERREESLHFIESRKLLEITRDGLVRC